MMSAIVAQFAAIVARSQELAPDPSTVLVLPDLQWWQTLVGILGVLGLSPAPWLLGLATNRIAFTKPMREDFNRQMADKDTAHVRELDARDRHHAALMAAEKTRYDDLKETNQANAEAAERNRIRAEVATDAALEVTEVVKASAHFMASVKEAAHIVATENQNGS